MQNKIISREDFPQDTNWFTEVHEDVGTAFSFALSEKLHSEQTPFQKIDIYETKGFGTLMVIDGYIMLSDRDNFLYHEMMSHPAIFTHPKPKKVVIIGGGDCGTLREVLKHKEIQSAVQIDIDERVTRLAEKYFPELCSANDDPRAELHFIDGIEWMRNTAPDSIDVIIVDSTDPVGPAEGLFNVEFYKSCHTALTDGGILVQQSESPIMHLDLLSSIHQGMRQAEFKQTHTLNFPQPVYPSGWWTATMARKGNKGSLLDFRQVDILPFETHYYTSSIHSGALATPHFLQKRLDEITA